MRLFQAVETKLCSPDELSSVINGHLPDAGYIYGVSFRELHAGLLGACVKTLDCLDEVGFVYWSALQSCSFFSVVSVPFLEKIVASSLEERDEILEARVLHVD